MCDRCEARRADPRRQAFPTVGVIHLVRVSEAEKEQKEDGSFDGLEPQAEIVVMQNNGVAKVKAMSLMRDPKISQAHHSDHVVCLN